MRIRDIQGACNSQLCVYVCVCEYIRFVYTNVYAHIVTIDFHQECWRYINYIITHCSVIYR